MNRRSWLICGVFFLTWLPATAGREPAASNFRLKAEATGSDRLWLPASAGRMQASGPQARAARPRVDFDRQIKPIIEKNCLECHSAEKRKGGLSLATYGDALDGGRNGAAIRPGASTRSIMIQRLLGRIEPQMPKDEDPLPSSEIALIRRWIDEGARETPASPPAPPPWEAPMALTHPTVPPVTWPAWSSPIDRFIAADMSKRVAAEPSVIADALFARRAYLDLWGLLPPPDALQAFRKDDSPDKRERLVQTLIADNQRYDSNFCDEFTSIGSIDKAIQIASEDLKRLRGPFLLHDKKIRNRAGLNALGW